MTDPILETNPIIFAAIEAEKKRQSEGLELIPSENYVSQAVLSALGSAFTNKYSEGYPGKRYYGGQEFTDVIERDAQDKAKKLFNAKFVNVQPLSGAPANLAAYFALLKPGDKILGMDLSHSGHLTHGHPMTFSAQLFTFVPYKTKTLKEMKNGELAEKEGNGDVRAIDYDELEEIAVREQPKLILAGFSSYPGSIAWNLIKTIADKVGAKTMADVSHIAGLIAAGVTSNPLDYGFDIMTTTTHKTLRGPRGAIILTNDEDIAKAVDKAVFPGLQGGPHMNVIAAKAVAFAEALHPNFMDYQQDVLANAAAMAKRLKNRGAVLVSGGTTNHLIVLDTWKTWGIPGKEAEVALDDIGITVNKNVVPDDERPPLNPSGIRLGTPALTTRGFTTQDCEEVGSIIYDCLKDLKEGTNKYWKHSLRKRVRDLAKKHPIPASFV